MITQTFYDLHDLVELVKTLPCAELRIEMSDGNPYITVHNYVDGSYSKRGSITMRMSYGDTDRIPAYYENVDWIYREVAKKIESGEWERINDRA